MAMYSVSASGTTILLTATKSFPVGFEISAFGKDNDPFDIPDLEVADAEIDLNNNFYYWGLDNPIETTINVAQNTDECKNLDVLFKRNGKTKNRALDQISLVKIFPDGTQFMLTEGIITKGGIGKPMDSTGKLKNKQFYFKFNSYTQQLVNI